jgi:ABC-2 type transport system permease protein
MQNVIYPLRVVWTCMSKEIQMSLAQRGTVIQNILRPIFFLAIMGLFAVGGGIAPTAVVMDDTGPYAQQFYDAMANAHSFRLQTATAQEAQALIDAGKIVAVVTIPADFDTQVQQNQPVQVPVEINNLNTDFTNDIRRAIPLSITLFYGKAFPQVVSVAPQEHDFYAQDTDYFPYLVVSTLVIALMILGLTNAGEPAAREYENATIKELLLSPANRLAIVVGKILGAFVMGLVSIVALLVVILLSGIQPIHWGEAIGFSLLTLFIFVAFGNLMGTLLKNRLLTTLVAFGAVFPIVIVSGPFGPITFQPVIMQVLAQLFPPYYAIVLEQHAFHNFTLNTYGLGLNSVILVGYALVLMVLAALALRRKMVAN